MDFLKICRACSSEKTNLLNLFANDGDDEPTLGEKFLVCTSLELHEADSYPQNICYACAKLLETAFKFRKQCERSFQQLEKKLHAARQKESHIKVEPCEDNNQQLESISVDDHSQIGDEDVQIEDQFRINPEEYDEINSVSDLKDGNVSQKMENDENTFHDSYEGTDSLSPLKDIDLPNKSVVNVDISIEEKPHQCNECNRSFFTSKARELHMKLNHKSKLNASNANNVTDILSSNAYQCSICNSYMASIDDLRMHRILDHGPKSLQCNICGKSTRDRIAYKKHLLAHKTADKHNCKICGKQYTDSRYLYRHMLYHRVTVYKCEETTCEKIFNVKHKYVEHIRLYHNRNLTSEEVRQIQPIVRIEAE